MRRERFLKLDDAEIAVLLNCMRGMLFGFHRSLENRDDVSADELALVHNITDQVAKILVKIEALTTAEDHRSTGAIN